MRHARAVLGELVLHVQPPKGCAIVLTERPFTKRSDPNWFLRPRGRDYTMRYTAKVAKLRKKEEVKAGQIEDILTRFGEIDIRVVATDPKLGVATHVRPDEEAEVELVEVLKESFIL
jgi:hypothetical protein